jgi:translation initiation factor IF-3
VDPDGVQLGIKPLPEALAIAKQLDLDLVEVAPMANPPVCRIMDFGKFKFDEAQRAKESRRKAVHVGIKEMKYRPKIGPGDFDTKTRRVGKFLNDGHKVKITIMFRGREVYHPEQGKRILDRIAEQMEGIAKVEAEPKLDNRNMIMVLAPDRRARQAAQSRASNQQRAEKEAERSDRSDRSERGTEKGGAKRAETQEGAAAASTTRPQGSPSGGNGKAPGREPGAASGSVSEVATSAEER